MGIPWVSDGEKKKVPQIYRSYISEHLSSTRERQSEPEKRALTFDSTDHQKLSSKSEKMLCSYSRYSLFYQF